MEFPFNVNDVLPDPICLVDERLAPFNSKYKHDRVTFFSKQTELKKIIDLMGAASTKAQNLRSPITSSIKLTHSDHRLYISKDPNANNGLGAVVGIIKIGHKKLFVQETQDVQHEVNPLCVLDFYIHESRQRTGCGKLLFDHVIKMEGISAEQLAIDKPSHKFLSFLKKHYNLGKPIPQVNNFVVYGGFFHDLQAVGLVPKRGQRLTGSSTSFGHPPLHPYKRLNTNSNEHLLSKRKAVNPPISQQRIPSQQSIPESTVQPMEVSTTVTDSATSHVRQPMEVSTTVTDSATSHVRGNEACYEVTLPPIVTRPPGRHSASRSQVGSSQSRWVLENSLVSGSSIPDTLNADRGLAARATAYSRYNSSRENSAPVLSTNKKALNELRGNVDSFERISSGGRKRNLHLTSAGNPLQTETLQQQSPSQVATKPETDRNANQATTTATTTTANANFISPTGNYSISQMYNNFYGRQRSFGTSWNVFGVPTGTGYTPNTMFPSRKPTSRTFPY